MAYKLSLPPNAKIYNVFHISLLKKKVGDGLGVVPLPDILLSEGSNFEPEKILARSYKKRGNIAATMWLIKWKNKAEEDTTWEFMTEILLRFSDFHP